MMHTKTVSLERQIKSFIHSNFKQSLLLALNSPMVGGFIKASKTESNLFRGRFDYDCNLVDLSRFRAAPSALLSHFPFKSDRAFPAQC